MGGGSSARGSKFYEELRLAKEEREVDFIYGKYLQKFFKEQITHPFKCDGLINTETASGKKLKIIFEYKYDLDFKKKKDIAEVLVQVVYYLKKFENNGQPLPNICFIGDINECFVMHTDVLNKYLDEPVDWNSAPSSAKFTNSALVSKIVADKDINPFVFWIDEKFRLSDVIDCVSDLAENVQRHIHITSHNIGSIYEYFCDRVLIDKNKISTKDSVAIFIGVLTDKEEYYMHPRKKNTLVAAPLNMEVGVKSDALDAFFSYFTENYSVAERRVFSGIADRLIEDADRRKSGDFWTPTKWVDYAHQRISEVVGDNWKNEFVVWDNCAGTCNLTRDYKFKELYISTLFDSELQMGKKFNREAEHFQFDFLNDFIPMPGDLIKSDCKLPDGLLDAFEQNKKIMFLINPPYARNNGGGFMTNATSDSVAFTNANLMMKNDGYGPCSANLYAQFLYRIEKIKQEYDLTNAYIGIFCPTGFLTGSSFEKFRKFFLNDFEYVSGFQFQASHFSDVSANWAIGFTIWKSGTTINKEDFEIDICDVDKSSYTGDVEIKSSKILYNIDNSITASEWACPVGKYKKVPVVPLTSGLKVGTSVDSKLNIGAFGGMVNKGNNVQQSAQLVAILNGRFNDKGTRVIDIMPENFNRVLSLFSARRLSNPNWTNWTDEFLAPDESHPDYKEFVNDSVVFSLFESKSNQSSLRSVDYKDKSWDIKNEFFWLSTSAMQKLAEKFDNDDCYDDALTSDERFVYKYLQNITLSKEAQAVLDYATKLVYQSFEFRQMFDDDYPDYQINNWDCGYYQLKALWKAYMPEELAKFRTLFNNLANKMRPMVYELGFLKK